MTQEEFDKALPLALTLFKHFYSELTTATTNSIKNFEGAMWHVPSMANTVSYYMGKRDAFAELSDRIEKEYNITANNAQYVLNGDVKNFGPIRDEDIEKMLPERLRGTRYDYYTMMRYRRALAELLSQYMREGFRLGRFYQKTEGKEPLEFKPVELSNACIEAFVHPEFRENQ